MTKISVAYFGSSYFSAQLLEKLLTDKTLPLEIKLVVTQPDKPVGRKQILTPTPVKTIAQKYKIKTFENVTRYKLHVTRISLCLVYAYGQVIPSNLLKLPKYGFWNIHPSLLPKYRGPSPIAYPLILGDKETGITLIKMDEQIDHGPIISQQRCQIQLNDKRPNLEIQLTDLSYQLFKKQVNELMSLRVNELKTITQDDKRASYTRLLKKDDGFLPLVVIKKAISGEALTTEELPIIIKEYLKKYPQLIGNWKLKIKNSSKIFFDYFRGLYPWPGIWALINIPALKRLKITDIDLISGKLIIKKVQLEGKKEVDFKTFNQAYKIF